VTDTISSDEAAANTFASTIKESLKDYLSYSFVTIADSNTARGSAVHDSLKGGLNSALSAWRDLIESDAAVIESAAEEFGDLDNSIAQGLMGIGG